MTSKHLTVTSGAETFCHHLQIPGRRVQPGGGWALLPGNRGRTRGNGLKLCQERFRLDIRKIPLWKWQFRPGTAAQGRGEVPIPGGFSSCVNVVDEDMGQWWFWQCWGVVGFDQHSHFQFKQFHDSVIPWFCPLLSLPPGSRQPAAMRDWGSVPLCPPLLLVTSSLCH